MTSTATRLTGRTCRCAGCGLLFVSETSFDGHRTGTYTPLARRCRTPDELHARGYALVSRRLWLKGRTSDQFPHFPFKARNVAHRVDAPGPLADSPDFDEEGSAVWDAAAQRAAEIKYLRRKEAQARGRVTQFARRLARCEHALATDPHGDYAFVHCGRNSLDVLRTVLGRARMLQEARAQALAELERASVPDRCSRSVVAPGG